MSSTPFRFFKLPEAVRNIIYSFLVVPEKGSSVERLQEHVNPATGCCYDDCSVNRPLISRARDAEGSEGSDTERSEETDGTSLHSHQHCAGIFKFPKFGFDKCQIHQRPISECTAFCKQEDEPSTHYKETYLRYRCLNVSRASKKIHQALTFFFFTRNTFEFHNSTDMLHFLRLKMLDYADVIRNVTLIYLAAPRPHF